MKLTVLLSICVLSAVWIGAQPRVHLAPATKTILHVAGRTSLIHSNHTNALGRRWDPNDQADGELYYKYICKGDQLWNAFWSKDAEAARIFGRETMRSEWQGDLRAELEAWGWTELLPNEFADYCDLEEHWMAGYIADALGISHKSKADGGDNLCWAVIHGTTVNTREQTYNHDGKQYRYFSGRFSSGLCGEPRLAGAPFRINPDDLPAIRHIADIMWSFWFRDNSDIKNLHYYWVQGIINEDTVSIAGRALADLGEDIKNYPGHIFSVEDDMAGKALLGSPIGIAIGYLLIAHKAELGNKQVSKVQLFIPGPFSPGPTLDYAAIDLLFHIEDAPM